MATSSKVQFNLETLTGKAFASIDQRISQTEAMIASEGDDDEYAARIKEWRTRQESRISDLFRRLGDSDIGDAELAKWEVEEFPRRDDYEMRRLRRDLASLKVTRSKMEAKVGSLVPDEKGNISLTKTQLADFFGL